MQNNRRRQNQKNSSGNFSTEIYGTTGKSSIPMKTTTGSQYQDVNGTPQAVIAIPKSNKSVTGLYFSSSSSMSSSSSSAIPLTFIRNILSKRLNMVSPFLNLLLMYRKL